ncbi:D-galactonate transporter [Minicystis rosea]|nr:D-galactonate transporter [Minicystis rosea]
MSTPARAPLDEASVEPPATSAALARPLLSRPAAWALALTATLTMSVSYIDRQTLAAIAPSVQKALAIPDSAYGDLVSAFSIAYLVGAPAAGYLIDRIGARRGLLSAVLLWSVVAALHALVPSFAVLFALRIALGLAEAPSFPGAAQTVHRALSPADRARGFGVLFTGSSIGAMIAPPLATWLADRYGFRAAFIGTALAGLLWVPLWVRVAYADRARRALDRHTVTAAPRLGAGALIRHPAVLRTVLVVLASAPLLSLLFNWGTKLLVHDHHLTQRQTGHYLWLPPLFFDAGAILFGHLASVARARGQGETGVPRSLLATACVVMLAGLYIPFAPTPELVVAAMCVTMVGGGGLYALPVADLSIRVPPSAVATACGLGAAAQSIAHIVANPMIGRSVERHGSYSFIVLALTLWIIPGCVGWLAWKPPPAWREEA